MLRPSQTRHNASTGRFRDVARHSAQKKGSQDAAPELLHNRPSSRPGAPMCLPVRRGTNAPTFVGSPKKQAQLFLMGDAREGYQRGRSRPILPVPRHPGPSRSIAGRARFLAGALTWR